MYVLHTNPFMCVSFVYACVSCVYVYVCHLCVCPAGDYAGGVLCCVHRALRSGGLCQGAALQVCWRGEAVCKSEGWVWVVEWRVWYSGVGGCCRVKRGLCVVWWEKGRVRAYIAVVGSDAGTFLYN